MDEQPEENKADLFGGLPPEPSAPAEAPAGGGGGDIDDAQPKGIRDISVIPDDNYVLKSAGQWEKFAHPGRGAGGEPGPAAQYRRRG